MANTQYNDDDKQDRAERLESITEQLSFKSRFVLLFGEINHSIARTTCERLIALDQQAEAPISVKARARAEIRSIVVMVTLPRPKRPDKTAGWQRPVQPTLPR